MISFDRLLFNAEPVHKCIDAVRRTVFIQGDGQYISIAQYLVNCSSKRVSPAKTDY